MSLLALVGVILADIPVTSVKEVDVVEKWSVLVTWTTWRILPALTFVNPAPLPTNDVAVIIPDVLMLVPDPNAVLIPVKFEPSP